MRNKDYLTQERMVELIGIAYRSFMDKPGFIENVLNFNKELCLAFGVKPQSFDDGTNRPLLTSDTYKAERDKGLSDEVIGVKYKLISPNQITGLSVIYNNFKKRELDAQEGREPSILERQLRLVFS